MIRPITRSIYALVAVVFLAAGAAVLLLGTGLLPARVKQIILDVGGGNDAAMHVLQEFSTLLVFTGLVNLWCFRNYDRSLYFHWAMTAFWGLFALVHWFDYHAQFQAGTGQVIVSLPAAVFLLLGILRQKSAHPQPRSGGSQ